MEKSQHPIKTPQNKEEQINFLVCEALELQHIIKSSYTVIMALDEERDLQKIYIEETMPFIWDYQNITEELKKYLKEHFEWEDLTQQAANLSFRKLYKLLKDVC